MPGFFGSERSLDPLVGWLREANYDAVTVPLELNVRGSGWAVDQLLDTLDRIGPAIVIGHSRGGQQARVGAVRRPELFEHLVTLGSPLRAAVPRHFVLRGTVETLRLFSRLGVYRPEDQADEPAYESDLLRPFDVDVDWTSIWSRTDGIVAWQSCRDRAANDIEVDCSHLGLTESVPAFEALAGVLAAIADDGAQRT